MKTCNDILEKLTKVWIRLLVGLHIFFVNVETRNFVFTRHGLAKIKRVGVDKMWL
jgi:hypothetical protein